MQQRILLRAADSGRSDDNVEAIQNRLKIYHEVSEPIIEQFKTKGMVNVVSSEADKESVYTKVRLLFKPPGTKYSFFDGAKPRKQNDDSLFSGGGGGDGECDNDVESDPTLFSLYEADDGFRGTYDEVVAHEQELERKKKEQVVASNPV
jgi:hypothetical protein